MWVADAVDHDEHLPDHEESSNEQWRQFTKQLCGQRFLKRNIFKFGIIVAYIAVSNLYGVRQGYTFLESTYFAIITVTSQGMGAWIAACV